MKDGLPIGFGYLAVSFALGIAARNAGINAFEGASMSVLNHASAGEYAGILSIAGKVTLLETALVTLVANLRYLLMSCALSQRIEPGMPMLHRILVGFGLTDEIFAITIGQEDEFVNPYYTYGSMMVAIPLWATGTALGILVGNILPDNVVSALSVALYGMFLAIIIPKAKKDKVVAGLVVISFVLSFTMSRIPLFAGLSSGLVVIILTIVISLAAAALFPVKEEAEDDQ